MPSSGWTLRIHRKKRSAVEAQKSALSKEIESLKQEKVAAENAITEMKSAAKTGLAEVNRKLAALDVLDKAQRDFNSAGLTSTDTVESLSRRLGEAKSVTPDTADLKGQVKKSQQNLEGETEHGKQLKTDFDAKGGDARIEELKAQLKQRTDAQSELDGKKE